MSRDARAEVEAALGIEHRSLGPAADPSASFRQAIAELQPDVVHGHTHKALPWLAAVAVDDGPLTVADLHGHLPRERWERRTRSLPRRVADAARAWADERRWAPRLGAFTVVCEALAVRARRWQRPVRVLWGGVDTELFRPAAGPPPPGSSVGSPPGGRLRIGYAGNFRPYQGVDVLVAAVERRLAAGADLELLLVGDLDAAPALARRARSLGERLVAPGPATYEDVPALLATADILAVPRPAHHTALYGFPSKLPEYMALGRPVVATRVGEQSKIVQHGGDGLLVAPGSAADLAAALADLEDEALRRRLGQAARRRAEATLTWDAAAATSTTFFEQLLADHAR